MTADKGVFDNAEPKPAAAEELPAYEAIASPSQPAPSSGPHSDSATPDLSTVRNAKTAGPTADAPFQFPTDTPLPSYSPPSASASEAGPSTARPKLIAIPQAQPTANSPFLPAYAPSLLRHGIVQQTFLSFVETVSAFLAAKVSDRAVAHAADVASRIGDGPKSHFKHVYGQGRDVFKGIGKDAKRGDIGGVVGGVIAGAVTLPITAALGTAGAVLSLPRSTVSAVAQKPQTGRQRAEAYIAVANKDWFHKRGIEAALVDSRDMAELLGVGVPALAEGSTGKKAETAEGLLGGFGGRAETLEISEAVETAKVLDALQVGPATLWLVLRRLEG